MFLIRGTDQVHSTFFSVNDIFQILFYEKSIFPVCCSMKSSEKVLILEGGMWYRSSVLLLVAVCLCAAIHGVNTILLILKRMIYIMTFEKRRFWPNLGFVQEIVLRLKLRVLWHSLILAVKKYEKKCKSHFWTSGIEPDSNYEYVVTIRT